MTEFKKINGSSSLIEQRFYLAMSCWAKANEETRPQNIKLDEGGREGAKDVSATSQSTYKSVSEARESKMPGGSSVSSLLSRSLKATRNRNSQPSLSVGHTELTALLYFICFQESFKRARRRTRRVLELCSWSMREAVAPLCS